MGQRRELRKPAGIRKMLADKRREVKRLKDTVKSLSTDLEGAQLRGIKLAGRFKVLGGIGSILLVKDTQRGGKR